MSDPNDFETDPIDQAYRQAEAAQGDEAARAARRARLLAAMAQETPAAPVPPPGVRKPGSGWRAGGWLIAAGVFAFWFVRGSHNAADYAVAVLEGVGVLGDGRGA